MEIKKLLIELKIAFEPYCPVWTEWMQYKFCGLSTTEIKRLEKFRKNNFRVKIGHLFSYHNQANGISSLIKKLQECAEHFREWLVYKFHHKLIKFAVDHGDITTFETSGERIDHFFDSEIETLKIDAGLKKTLLKFCRPSLSKTFSFYAEKEFETHDILFSIIREAYVKMVMLMEQPTMNPTNIKLFIKKSTTLCTTK